MRGKKKSVILAVLFICLLAVMPLQALAAKSSITLSEKKLTLIVGKSKTLTANVVGKNSNVKWSSSKASVASVDSNGKITAKKAGKTTIKAKANGKTAKCVVTVKKLPAYIKAYKNFLSKRTINWDGDSFSAVDLSKCQFALAYIDNNIVPELIIYAARLVPHSSGYGKIYTYRNGKVKLVENLNLNTGFYYYKKKGIYADTYYGSGSNMEMYKLLKNGKAAAKLVKDAEDLYGTGNTTMKYYEKSWGGKKLTRAAFNKKLKKLVGSKKKTQVAFVTNTAENRATYIK